MTPTGLAAIENAGVETYSVAVTPTDLAAIENAGVETQL